MVPFSPPYPHTRRGAESPLVHGYTSLPRTQPSGDVVDDADATDALKMDPTGGIPAAGAAPAYVKAVEGSTTGQVIDAVLVAPSVSD